jgi:16S rRNA (uracil1498-N3)-methyltransferase
MRTIRIYQPGDYQIGQTILLSEAAAQHVGLVLRLPVGTPLIIFRGDNQEYQGVITHIHKKQIQIKIESSTLVNRESFRKIHLAQSLAKGDKMEWIIQKAVELGVASITPLLSERSVIRLDAARLEKKQHQWQAIAISACEQSGRNHIPHIHPVCSLADFLEHCTAQYKWLLSPEATQSWPTLTTDSAEIAVLIGPEGGFSPQELTLSHHYHVSHLRLGPRILRTETAAITAIGMLQMLYGDLNR